MSLFKTLDSLCLFAGFYVNLQINMHADAKPPTELQRKKLCELIYQAFLEIRLLGHAGKAEQASELADAFHNLPTGMWQNDFSLEFFRDAFLKVYQAKYPDRNGRNFVAMVNEIIALKD